MGQDFDSSLFQCQSEGAVCHFRLLGMAKVLKVPWIHDWAVPE